MTQYADIHNCIIKDMDVVYFIWKSIGIVGQIKHFI